MLFMLMTLIAIKLQLIFRKILKTNQPILKTILKIIVITIRGFTKQITHRNNIQITQDNAVMCVLKCDTVPFI